MKAGHSKKVVSKKAAPKAAKVAKPSKPAKGKPASKKAEGKPSKKKGKDGEDFEEFEIEGEEIDFPIEESFDDDFDGAEDDDDF